MTFSAPAFGRAKAFINEKLAAIRNALSTVGPNNSAVLTFGSYARREASAQSDLDYIIVHDPQEIVNDLDQSSIVEEIRRFVRVEPSPTGAFGKIVSRRSLLENIGGGEDNNENLTRRMLLLLEGEYLKREDIFLGIRKEIIETYVSDKMKNHQLALFMLNDIIRYWRTMTADYRFKVSEGKKPWAIRKIKLVFSRKLMYAGGVFSVAMTSDRTYVEKRRILEDLFAIPALERMAHICGEQRTKKLFEIYDKFLEKIELRDVKRQIERRV